MTGKSRWAASAAAIVGSTAALAIAVAVATSPQPAIADDSCPNGGTVRFGVEPYDTAARLVPIYEKVGKLIGDQVGCKVEVFVATGYNAEIEAMRNDKLEIGEFGPLGYVLAHQVAKAEAVAAFGTADGKPDTYWASIVTYPSSGIKTVADIRGRSFAFSDPASTSGHLFPAYGLRKAGLDPDKDVKAIYGGSHTASFEAIYNHKVDAGELNSEQLEFGKAARSLQGRRSGFLVEIRRHPDRPNRGARRPARGVQEEAHECAAASRSNEPRSGRPQDYGRRRDYPARAANRSSL